MSYKVNTFWDEDKKVSKTIIIDTTRNKKYEGIAKCSPEDSFYVEEYVGQTISEMRAKIEMLKDIRDNEILPQIKILEHIYTNMNTSAKFNPNSYEAKMLRRQLSIKKGNLEAVVSLIDSSKIYIYEYLDIYRRTKEIFEAKKNTPKNKND